MKGFIHLDFREQLTLISTLLMCAIVVLLIIIHSYLNIRQSKEMARKYLVAITEGTAEIVDCWLEEKKNVITMISESDRIRDFSRGKSENISGYFHRPSFSGESFDFFFIAGRDGNVLVTSDENAPLGFTNIMQQPWWQDFEKVNFRTFLVKEVAQNPISRRLCLMILTGVRDETGLLIGFLGGSVDWEDFINKYIIPIKVGQTGYVAVTDEKGRNIGHQDRSLNFKDLSHLDWMKPIITEKNGFQEYTFFKGVPKLMAYKQSRQSGWIVNASVNEAELVEGPVYARNVILWIGTILLVCMLTGIGYVDIFRLGKVQRELRESQWKYRLIFNLGTDGIFVHALDPQGHPGTFREVNEAFCQVVQLSKNSVLASSPKEILRLDCKGGYDGVVQAAVAEKHRMIETTMALERGKVLHVEIRMFLLEMESQRYILGFIRNITNRIHAKENLNRVVQERTRELKSANVQLRRQIEAKEEMGKALRESEEKYRNLVVRANDGIIVVQDGRIQFANDKMLEILNYTTEELLGMEYLRVIAPEDREAVMDRYRLRVQGERVDSMYEAHVCTKDGTLVDVELNAGLIHYEGRTADFIYVRDITERKRIAEEKRRHEERLIEADKLVALGTLVSGVAHEINNPNNSIMLNTPVLREAWGGVQPIVDEYVNVCGDFRIAGMPYSMFKGYVADILEHVQKSSSRIKVIVDDLKDFVRPNHSELAEKVDINEMVRASVNLISNLIMKSTKEFYVEYGENIPAITGSYQRLEQVVVNLIQNSCNALDRSDRAIRVCTKYLTEEKQIQIQVYDEGHGIDPDHMSKITDPFFTTKRGSGGTGLGLSVSLKLIQDHRGTITFESEVGQGTTATILLPATQPTVEANA